MKYLFLLMSFAFLLSCKDDATNTTNPQTIITLDTTFTATFRNKILETYEDYQFIYPNYNQTQIVIDTMIINYEFSNEKFGFKPTENRYIFNYTNSENDKSDLTINFFNSHITMSKDHFSDFLVDRNLNVKLKARLWLPK